MRIFIFSATRCLSNEYFSFIEYLIFKIEIVVLRIFVSYGQLYETT